MIGSGARGGLVGLRVDVDTYEGMRAGVPALLDTLRRAGVAATFYLSMGPDRSGLALRNLLKPGFLAKMRRTRAARTYGLRTILSGTLLPARPIALSFPAIARAALGAGHEVGVHAWDHRLWQDRLLSLAPARVAGQLDEARSAYEAILGSAPRTFAAPAWLCSGASLAHQELFGLAYASDCRGTEPFLPVVDGAALGTPQVPATLPTLDEAIGETCDDAKGFFDAALETAAAGGWPVLTIHAEMEGMAFRGDFARFLEQARGRGLRPVPLRDLLEARLACGGLPAMPLGYARVRGRHGLVSMQAPQPAMPPAASRAGRHDDGRIPTLPLSGSR